MVMQRIALTEHGMKITEVVRFPIKIIVLHMYVQEV